MENLGISLFFPSVFGLFSCSALNPLLIVVTSNRGILWRQFVSPERLRYSLHMQQECFQTRQIPSVLYKKTMID